jgi:hypothetical protein
MMHNDDRPSFIDDIDARQRLMWQRKARKARLQQAGILFWIFASTFVIVPLIFHHSPLWIVAIATGVIGAIVGWLLPTNVPMPHPPNHDSDRPYGVYDPRGPYGPRS